MSKETGMWSVKESKGGIRSYPCKEFNAFGKKTHWKKVRQKDKRNIKMEYENDN